MGVLSCKKDKYEVVKEIVEGDAPIIFFMSVVPTEVKEYGDSLVFTIAYQDQNGDLGENDPDVENVFLVDNRIDITYKYRLSQLAPLEANVPIRGTFEIVLPNTGITDGSSEQTGKYTLYIVDRAGNKSNRVLSADVKVTK